MLLSSSDHSRPPLRMRVHQRVNGDTHTPGIDVWVPDTLLHHHLNAGHDTTVAERAPDSHLVVTKGLANARSRPTRPKSIVPSGLTVGLLMGHLRRSACSVAAGRVAVECDDTHLRWWMDRGLLWIGLGFYSLWCSNDWVGYGCDV
jgi:hypothetical protein